MDIIQDQNNLLTYISIIIGFFGIVLAILFYVKGRKFKKLVWMIESNNMFLDTLSRFEKLKISYSGKEINTMTVSKIAIWNKGTEPISITDIAPADPIKIVFKEKVQLLELNILQRTNEINMVNVINQFTQNSSLIITFDFLNKDDGIALQLFHTGTSSNDISVSGTIIGSSNPERIFKDRYENSSSRKSIMLYSKMMKFKWTFNIYYFLMFLLGICLIIFHIQTIIGYIFSIFFGLGFIFFVVEIFSSRIPSKLDINNN
jgi:hypothetical protein